MLDYTTIWEDFQLPSKGLIYDKPLNPNISLRSMTTAEEMRRLSPTKTPYKVMSDIIEDCMQPKLPVHVCDLSLGDYQYLLHKLRIVTYGTDYKMICTCPSCQQTNLTVANLDDLEVHTYSDDILAKKLIKLPVSNFEIELKFQTPHDMDLIAYQAEEYKKQKKNNVDYSMLFTLMSLISSIDGKPVDPKFLKDFVIQLPARDGAYILNKATELNTQIGVDAKIKVTCPFCGKEFNAPFRITSEFFGPSEN